MSEGFVEEKMVSHFFSTDPWASRRVLATEIGTQSESRTAFGLAWFCVGKNS